MQQEVEWAKLPASEIRKVAQEKNALAILPIGSLEQHGPHLPVITDTQIAIEVSHRAAKLVAYVQPVLVLPAIWTGMSEHHLPFGGTISLNYTELRGLLTGVARSLKVLGFSRLLIVNHHGGNHEPLAVISRELAAEFGMAVVSTLPWFIDMPRIAELLETDDIETTGLVGHACEAETSVMMLATPELVRRELIDSAYRATPGIKYRRGFSRFWSFSELQPRTGVMGDPRPATPEKGEKLLNALAEMVANGIRDEEMWRVPDDIWSPGRGLGNTDGASYEGK
jgi:creatinine amidohydrolase